MHKVDDASFIPEPFAILALTVMSRKDVWTISTSEEEPDKVRLC